MRSSFRLAALGAVFAIGAALSSTALAVDKAKILKDRQELMKEQGRQWLVIRNYLQGKADQAAALSAAGSLTKSVPTVPNYFPPGSEGPNPDGKWGPKPEVWSQRDKFLAADKKVAEQVGVLDAAIRGGDKTKVEVAFKELDVCSACHKTFRAKLQ